MYGGESIKLTLDCSEKIAKNVRSEFGENIVTTPAEEGRFKTEVRAAEGEGLLRWLMQFGAEDMKVLAPENIKIALKERAEKLYKSYE